MDENKKEKEAEEQNSEVVAAPKPVESSTTQEPEVTSNSEAEVVSDDILAQQPLMAAFLENNPQEVSPTEPVEESTNPFENGNPLASTLDAPKETTEVSIEEAKEEVEPAPVASVENPIVATEEKLPEEKKKVNLKPIIAIVLALVLLVGGFFVYTKIFGGLNPLVRKIDNVDDAIEYFDKKYNAELKREGDTSLYEYDGDDFYIRMSAGENDKIGAIMFTSEEKKMDEAIKIMTPFIKAFSDQKVVSAGLNAIKDFDTFAYKGKKQGLGIYKDDDEIGITVGFGKTDEDEDNAKIESNNKIKLSLDGYDLTFNLKNKYGKGKYDSVTIGDSSIMLLSDESAVVISVDKGTITRVQEDENTSIIKEEDDEEVAGVRGYLYEDESVMYRSIYKGLNFYIPANGKIISFDSSQESVHFDISIAATDDSSLSFEDMEEILEELIKSMKIG